MAKSAKPANDDMGAQRLIALRRMIAGESQTAFATRMGLEVKRWNNFERGKPLSKEVAIALVQRIPGLTLDWLHLGKADGLPGTLRRELEEAGKATNSAEGRTRRR